MNFQQAAQYLDDLQFFKIKLGLDSMNRFLARLDNPHHTINTIHIGGTNGKGSVGATLCSILSAADYKTGFYTSPHLSSPRERFRINDSYINKEDFARLLTRIRDLLGSDQITYFECTTTLAMLWFAEQEVDFAILEVGMGGRLDATNVVTPLLSIITNVSMDHEQYLGTTLAEIAGEKAGIIKAEIPVVSGAAADDSGRIIKETCEKLQAPLYLYGRDFSGVRQNNQDNQDNQESLPGLGQKRWQFSGVDGVGFDNLPMNMAGRYQVSNACLALTAIQLLQSKGWDISEEQIRNGLEQTSWPGRLESFCLNGDCFLLDGAHNPAGVAALKQALIEDFTWNRLILIWGAMADKDLATTLQEIAPLAEIIIFTRPESERSATGQQLLNALPETLCDKAVLTDSVAESIALARERAVHDDLICIAGSLYLIGAARDILFGSLVNDG